MRANRNIQGRHDELGEKVTNQRDARQPQLYPKEQDAKG